MWNKIDKTREEIKKKLKAAKKAFISLDVEKHEKSNKFPGDIYRKLGKLGLIAPYIDKEYGGQGWSFLKHVILIEGLCRIHTTIGSAMVLASVPAKPIVRQGTAEQKEKYLINLTAGIAVSAIAITEPKHGSDITSLDSYALKHEGGYKIRGVKQFVTNGNNADFFTVLCQTKKEAGHKGMSMFVVERDDLGENFFTRHMGKKIGLNLSSVDRLVFKGLYVPGEALLGEENKGYYYTQEFFDESRIEIAALSVGIAQSAFDSALRYARSRRQFKKALVDMTAIQRMFTVMHTRIERARELVYKAAYQFDQGNMNRVISAQAKIEASETALFVAIKAMQIHGARGVMSGHPIARICGDAQILPIFEGANSILKKIIVSSRKK